MSANTGVVTHGGATHEVQQYYDSVIVQLPSTGHTKTTKYCFLSRVDPWDDPTTEPDEENSPPTPSLSNENLKNNYNNKFYNNGVFSQILASDLSAFGGDNGSGISFSFLPSKNDISSSIFQTISNLNNDYNLNSSNQTTDVFKQLRILNSQFNFLSEREVQTYLLQDYPDNLVDDYPFSSLKVSFNIPLSSDYSFIIDDLFQFENDVYNQVYLDLDSLTKIFNKHIPSAPSPQSRGPVVETNDGEVK